MNFKNTDPDYIYKITPDLLKQIMNDYMLIGFNAAIEALSSKEADALNEMYASGFAEWLEKNKDRLIRGQV